MLADKADQCKSQIEFLSISLSSVNATTVAQAADDYIFLLFYLLSTKQRMCVYSLSMLDISQLFDNLRYFNIILRDSSQFLSFFFFFPLCAISPHPFFCIRLLKFAYSRTILALAMSSLCFFFLLTSFVI